MLLDDAEMVDLLVVDPTARICRCGVSTPETRARYEFLKSKRLGSTWREGSKGHLLYRMGAGGTTVYDLRKLGMV